MTEGANAFLRHVPYISFIATFIGSFIFRPWRKGAMTSAFAAAGADLAQDKARFKGIYFTPVAKVSEPSKAAQDERLAKELWETTENILKELDL